MRRMTIVGSLAGLVACSGPSGSNTDSNASADDATGSDDDDDDDDDDHTDGDDDDDDDDVDDDDDDDDDDDVGDDDDADDDDDGPSSSAGCGLEPPATGTLSIDIDGVTAEYILSLPPDYDAEQPYPLGFGFHGWGRTGQNCLDGDCAGFHDVLQDKAVLVYMTAIGGAGWEGDGEREPNVAFFNAVLEHVLANACIDTDTIFAAGTSSGAHFSNVLGCRYGDRLAAIVPVAGFLPERDDCVGHVAALVIHGFRDPHVVPMAGEEARDFWRDRNGCTDTTVPAIVEVHDEVVATEEHHACAQYQGCDPTYPVTWCEHSEGGYDDSTHGWPQFGGTAIWEFVSAL